MNKDKIKEAIEQIFKHTACTLTKCEFVDENGILWCSIETPDSNFIIGREGETLRSLNHIVQRIVEKGTIKEEERGPSIFIDVNGYQKKRFENLKNIAHMMAERARYFKSNIEIDPMPSYERRIIHMFLEGAKNIKTESEGYGPTRRVVIKYVNND
ncbi:MAG: R3H domain-containing nucleic acid-binding protein [Candidatus Paceibacterota bacterium]|jgi:spoIIIJ-associated protein